MKKLFLALIFCLGVAQVSNAQSDYSLISRFINGVINNDIDTLIETLDPDCYDDIDKLLAQNSALGFGNWQVVATDYGDGFTRYVVAVECNNLYSLSEEEFPHYNRIALISPSGHCFLYESLCVMNGKVFWA